MEKRNLTLKREKNYTDFSTPVAELLLKIHTATGWRMPKTEKECIFLSQQLEKKLRYDYPLISYDQVETAFMQFGSEENFTGSMSIAQIDKVLRKYFASITEENFNQERRSYPQTIPIPLPEQHLNECRELIEHKYQLYLSGKMNVELLPAFIWPILAEDYGLEPELPAMFVLKAKGVIAERKGGAKFRRGEQSAENVLMKIEAGYDDTDNVAVKLAIEYSFEIFKNRNQERLYYCES